MIIASGLIAYCNIFSHGFSLDDAYIFGQLPDPSSGLSGVFSVFKELYGHADYRPVVLFSFALEQWFLQGINPGLSHGINLLLFIGTGLLAYRILIRLTGPDKQLIALLSVLFFMTHPVHSSVVSSLKNRDNILSLLFGLMSWYFCLRALQDHWIRNSLIAVSCLAIALFAKLDALSFLLIIPLSFILFYPAQRKKTATLFLVLLLALFARAMAVVFFPPAPNSVLFTENPVVLDWTLANRLAQSIQTLFYYLKFMLIPKGYWFYFGYNTLPVPALASLATLIYILVHLVFITGIFWFREREKTISFGLLFFYTSLLYCCNFMVPVAGILADRYAFIASLGYCIALAGLICYINQAWGVKSIPAASLQAGRQKERPVNKNPGTRSGLLWILAGMIGLVHTGFTIDRNRDWKDTESLLAADMPHLENSFEANRIAASAFFKTGIEGELSPETKLDHIRQGLKFALQAQRIYAGNQYISESIGQAYFNTGQPEAAITQLRETLSKFDTSRISMEVLGDIYFLRDQPDSALYFYNLSIKSFPAYEPVYFKYLRSLVKMNDLAAAAAFSNGLLQQYPEWYLPYQCQSYYYMERKDSLAGLRWYKASFDKGFRNSADAAAVREKLLRFGDTLNARGLDQYIRQ